MFCIIMPGCNFSYSHCSCLFNGLWKKNPLYSCSQTINRVLFDMNNCKTWMWDETYLEESVLERTFLPVYQVPLVLVLFLILCWYKKKEKIISRHWTMHGSTWFDGSLWQSGQCLVIAADLLHCIYIYIWNKTRTIDLFFIFNNLFESSKTCWSYYENRVLLSFYNRFFVFTLNILCFKMKWKGICFTKVLYSQL